MQNPLYLDGILEVKSYRAIQNTVAEVVKSFGLNTVSEWFVLSHIYYTNGAKASDLADILNVEPPFITAMLSGLEAKELVEKETDEEDKRVKLLTLSSKGAELVPEMEYALQAALDNLLEGVRADELEKYKAVMKKIVRNSKQS